MNCDLSFSANTNADLIPISYSKVRALKTISLIYKHTYLVTKTDKIYMKKKYLYKYCPLEDI